MRAHTLQSGEQRFRAFGSGQVYLGTFDRHSEAMAALKRHAEKQLPKSKRGGAPEALGVTLKTIVREYEKALAENELELSEAEARLAEQMIDGE